MTTRRTAAAGVLAALSCAASAGAGLVEFTFEGIIDQIDGTPGAPWDVVEVGDPWEVSYIFESDQPDQIGSPFEGLYDFETLTFTLDDVSETTTAGEIDVILGGFDEYAVLIGQGAGGISGSVRLLGFDVFDTDALPLDLDLDDFTSKRLEVGIGGQATFRGFVTTFSVRDVPSPSGFLLLVTMFIRGSRSRGS
ncbi:MAG: hypothetical protein ACYTGG_05350 [Planctomycetota bacterium]|jgi:hypothetical protein